MKMAMTLRYGIPGFLLSLLLLFSLTGRSQMNVHAGLDTGHIRIGEQPVLTLTLEHRSSENKTEISFPTVGDSLGDHIEVLERSSVDTVKPAPDRAPDLRRIERSFRITSFDTGYHAIPPFPFRVGDDTVRTDPLMLSVEGVDVGKEHAFRPIKDIERFPYTWKAWFYDHWPWFAGLGAVLLALLLFLLYRRYRKHSEPEPEPEPERPPQELAMERLRELQDQKAWQEWEAKAFYTELSDILRHFLEDRYRIPALEETTAKILHELAFTEIDEEGKGRVRKILKEADMAKFAKQRPESRERERALEDAIAFVQRSVPLKDPEEVESNG